MRETPLTRDDITIKTRIKYAYIELDMLNSVYLLTAKGVVSVYNLFRNYHSSTSKKVACHDIGYGPTVVAITVKKEDVSEMVDKLGKIIEDPTNRIRSDSPGIVEERKKARECLARAIRSDPLNRILVGRAT